MSVRFIVAAVAAVAVGYVTEDPYLAAQTFAFVYGASGFLDPNKQVLGPKLRDLKAPTASYGAPIAYVEGAPRLAGQMVYASEKRQLSTTTSQSKGGPGVDTTTYSYEIDVRVILACNQCVGVRRIWSNGKLVYSRADNATAATLLASTNTNSWRDLRFYSGALNQMPDPVEEAAVGVGNSPAYRARASVFIEGLNLGNSGQLPVLTFEVVSSGTLNGTVVERALSEVAFTDPAIDPFRPVNSGADGPASYAGPGYVYFLPAFFGGSVDRWYYTVTEQLDPFDAQLKAFVSGPVETDQGFSGENFVTFLDGLSDVPGFWIAASDTGLGFGPMRASNGTTYPDAAITKNSFAHYGGNTLLMFAGLSPFTTFPRGIGYMTATTPTAWIPMAAARTGGLWYVLPRDSDGSIYIYDGGLNLTGTIADPRLAPTGGMIVADTSTGELYVLDAANVPSDLFKWDGAAWNVVMSGLGPYMRGRVSYTGITVTNGQLYSIAQVGLPGPVTGYRISTADPYSLVTLALPTLDEVVERLCVRTGLLTPADLDVTALAADVVRGMAISQVSSTRSAIETLSGAYLFECVERGDVLRFVKRGGAAALTIPYADLGTSHDGTAEPLPKRRGDDIEVAAQVTVRFANTLNDFQDGIEAADRLVTGSTAVSVVEVPLGFEPQEAKRIADAQTMDLAVSLVQLGPISLQRKYAALEPTDVIIVTDRDGSTFRCRIVKGTIGGGVYTFDLVLDDASAINSAALTSAGYSSSTLVRVLAATGVEMLDSPILRDADDGPGFYAAFGASGRWPGAELDKSFDGVSYTKAVDASDLAIMGIAGTALGNFTGGYVFDELNTLTVDVGSSTLSSVSRDVLLTSDANALAVGLQTTGWEIIQFRTASLVSPGVYLLSGFLRGRRGTEWRIASHADSEHVVLLRTIGMRRVVDAAGDLGVPFYWKAVTYGTSRAATTAFTFADNGVGLECFSPVDGRAVASRGGDITIDWKRRTRLSTRLTGAAGISAPLGEATEAYEVDIFSSGAYTTPLRTLYSTSESVVYPAAAVATDLGGVPATLYAKVYQISATVGRGYPLTLALGIPTVALFVPDLLNPRVLVQLAVGDAFIATREGTSVGRAIGIYGNDATVDDTLHLLAVAPANVSQPYGNGQQIAATDPATGAYVLLLRGAGNPSGMRRLFYGIAPSSCVQVVPTFMPATPPYALWWTGSEFRALLTDAHVWSSPTGAVWTDEGLSTGAPATTAGSISGAYVVEVAGALALKFDNEVHFCADTDGLTWTPGTGDVAPLPTATYTTFFGLIGIATNGTLGVIAAIGQKPSDPAPWGLLYTTTDGEDWTEEYEVALVAPPITLHDNRLNTGLVEFGGDFLSTFWPPIGGTSIDSILPVTTFGTGETVTFAHWEALLGKAGAAAVLAHFRYGANIPYRTTDLTDSVALDWSET